MKTKRCNKCRHEAVGFFVTSKESEWLCGNHKEGIKYIDIRDIRNNSTKSEFHDMWILNLGFMSISIDL